MRAARAGTLVLLTALGGGPACAPDESSVGAVGPGEPGLRAQYFEARALQEPAGVYEDPNVDFDGWRLNQLVEARGHAARSLSIRWSGQIRFADAEPYALRFELLGRVRLWIDDALIIDDWVDSGVLRWAGGTIAVPEAGWRDVRIEWDQLDGPMIARMTWRSPSRPAAIVPASALRHFDP